MKHNIGRIIAGKIRTKVVLLVFILTIMLKTTVYAASTEVGAKINGDVKNGNSVDIVFSVKNISRLYAGSFELVYDPSSINVDSISGGDFIKTNNPKIMEFGGDTAKNGNITNYYFTCVGKVDGFTGGGNYVIVKATIKDSSKFALYKKNIKIQLVERTTNNEMKDISYTLTGDVKDDTVSNDDKSQPNSSNKDDSNKAATGKTDENGKSNPDANTEDKNKAGSTSDVKNNEEKDQNKAQSKGFISSIISDIKNFFSGSDSKEKVNNSKETSSNNKDSETKKDNATTENKNNKTDEKDNNTTNKVQDKSKNNTQNTPDTSSQGKKNDSKEAISSSDKVEVAVTNKYNNTKYIVTGVAVVVLAGLLGWYIYMKKRK